VNQADRELRFTDTYVASALAALKLRDPPGDDEVELYIALLLEEAEQFWRVYREYEGRQV
jgi:hypothetical protein